MTGPGLRWGVAMLAAVVAFATPAKGFCDNCGTTYNPICAKDGQTYGNDCIRQCAAVLTNYKGKCSSDCFPFGDTVDCESYDWDDKQMVCVGGLTWQNLANARCDGWPKKPTAKCYQKGVCEYGIRNGNVVTFATTSKGRGESVATAANNTKAPSRINPRYRYNEALTKAMVFFDTMVSGRFESAGHRRLTWRKNSCLGCKGKYGEDLSGGFYEAGGSFLKFPLINSYMTVMLAWSGIEYKDGYEKTKNWNDLRWKVKWGADFLLSCYVRDYLYMGLHGNDTTCFDNFSPPELESKYVPTYPTGYITKTNKGSEVLADSAAALAASAILLSDKKEWAANAISKAKKLYDWAREYPGSYRGNKDPVMEIHVGLYDSQGYTDELAWAAIWLYKATKETKYLEQARSYFFKCSFNAKEETFELNSKYPALAILIAQASSDARFTDAAKKFFDAHLKQDIFHTPRGLAYPYSWGGIRFGGNVAFLSFVHAKNRRVPDAYRNRLRNYALFQINYILGDSGRSWMVGFGENYSRYLWHKASWKSVLDWKPEDGEKIWSLPDAGPWASGLQGSKKAYLQKAKFQMEGSREPNARIAYGSLFTPLADDNMVASRKDYSYAEPTIEYNAGITGALAAAAEWYQQGTWTGSMKDVLSRP